MWCVRVCVVCVCLCLCLCCVCVCLCACARAVQVSLSVGGKLETTMSEDHMDMMKAIVKTNSHELSGTMHLPPKVSAASIFDMDIQSGPLRAVVDLHHTTLPAWKKPGVAEPPRTPVYVTLCRAVRQWLSQGCMVFRRVSRVVASQP